MVGFVERHATVISLKKLTPARLLWCAFAKEGVHGLSYIDFENMKEIKNCYFSVKCYGVICRAQSTIQLSGDGAAAIVYFADKF